MCSPRQRSLCWNSLNAQALLKSSPANRAIVAAAVRFTFIDTSSSYDEVISPLVVDFLSLMHDENYVSLSPHPLLTWSMIGRLYSTDR